MPKYCMNCMRPLEASPVCRHCGFSNANKQPEAKYHLRPYTLLTGRYLVGRVLGEGGFGITYIGLDATLSKRVAIKEFYPMGAASRFSDDSNAVTVSPGRQEFFNTGVERFLFEAKSVAAFSDEDGIVDVLDYFQENNTAYIVMEYLEGENLKQHVVRTGVMPPDTLINLMLPVMRSLRSMHAKGIIHRDISPDNIMLTKSGKLKLTDFGSARFFTNRERQLSIVLKQGFAPEEQYRKNSAQGPYTDVYALCATMYACITGQVPPDSLDRMAHDDLVPPSALGIHIAPHQERALLHGLALLAPHRTQNMNELIAEFTSPADIGDGYDSFDQRRKPSPPPEKESKAPAVIAVILTIVAVLAVGGVIWFMMANNDGGKPQNATTAAPAQTYAPTEAIITTENNEVIAETTKPKATRPIYTVPPTTFAPKTEKPTTEPATERDEPTTEPESDIQELVNDKVEKYNYIRQYAGDPEAKGEYDVRSTWDGCRWISYPAGTTAEGGDDIISYFFDENGQLFFIFEKTDGKTYQYYIDDDTIIRYINPGGIPYDEGDYHITYSMQQKVKDANNAFNEVKGY